MMPGRIIFATNANAQSGAGHIMRLIEISRALPALIEKYFFGTIGIPWISDMAKESLLQIDSLSDFGSNDLVVLDSYDPAFCIQVNSMFSHSQIIQIADRYSFLLPRTAIIYMDLPFSYRDSLIESRVVAHGIKYLPMRSFAKRVIKFEDQAKKVLVSTGGLVNETIFSQLIGEVAKVRYQNICFEFIGQPESLVADYPNFKFYSFGQEFDSIAGGCDTAISAAGTTMWDLLANRKLVGLAATVENQKANFDYAIKSGQALQTFLPEKLQLDVDALQSLLFDSRVRKSLYEQISEKYDYFGAARVVEVILDAFLSGTLVSSHR